MPATSSARVATAPKRNALGTGPRAARMPIAPNSNGSGTEQGTAPALTIPPPRAPRTQRQTNDFCPFCEIIDDVKKAKNKPIEHSWVTEGGKEKFLVMKPLDPVTENGHILIIPHTHVKDTRNHQIFAEATSVAMEVAAKQYPRNENFNIITNNGKSASQTVFHLHVHLVMRTVNDGLKLPWTQLMTEGSQDSSKAKSTFIKGRWDNEHEKFMVTKSCYPVTKAGHYLVMDPRQSETWSANDYGKASAIAAEVASTKGHGPEPQFNTIICQGEFAGETYYCRVHTVMRTEGDGVILPWTEQQKKKKKQKQEEEEKKQEEEKKKQEEKKKKQEEERKKQEEEKKKQEEKKKKKKKKEKNKK